MNAIFSFVHCLNELSNSLGPFASWAELFTFITEYSYFVFLRLTLTGSQTTATLFLVVYMRLSLTGSQTTAPCISERDHGRTHYGGGR